MKQTTYQYWFFDKEDNSFTEHSEENKVSINSFTENNDTNKVYKLLDDTREKITINFDEFYNTKDFLYWTMKGDEFKPYNSDECDKISHFYDKELKKIFCM